MTLGSGTARVDLCFNIAEDRFQQEFQLDCLVRSSRTSDLFIRVHVNDTAGSLHPRNQSVSPSPTHQGVANLVNVVSKQLGRRGGDYLKSECLPDAFVSSAMNTCVPEASPSWTSAYVTR